jgi:hypothetical protein
MGDRELKDAVLQLTHRPGADEVSIAACSVDAVDPASRSCDCTPINGRGTAQFIGVQLMADVDDGFFIVPIIGSTVLVAYSKHNTPFVSMFSQVDRVIMATVNGFQFEDGTFGGMAKVEALTEKINNLENDLNTLKQVFATWVTIPEDGGAALKAAAAEWAGDLLTVTNRSDIENTNLTHGS